MKETVNVSVGHVAFVFDEDAFRQLSAYLDAIGRRLPAGDRETLEEVEARIAEILCGRLSSPMRVVTLAMVREAMSRMGDPSEFGELPREKSDEEPAVADDAGSRSRRRLYRSRRNSSVAGICGGLADFFGVDATLLRLITLFLILFGGLSLWVYIVLWIIIPLEPKVRECR